MALRSNKAINLTGESTIESNGMTMTVVSMSANVKGSSNSNIVATIINQELYDANKETCRADIDAFTAMVREIEDAEAM